MRICMYAAFNKKTNERVYTNCRSWKVKEFISTQENPENYEVRYKFMSA